MSNQDQSGFFDSGSWVAPFRGGANLLENAGEAVFGRTAGIENLTSLLGAIGRGLGVANFISGLLAGFAHLLGFEKFAEKILRKGEQLAARSSMVDENAFRDQDNPAIGTKAPGGPDLSLGGKVAAGLSTIGIAGAGAGIAYGGVKVARSAIGNTVGRFFPNNTAEPPGHPKSRSGTVPPSSPDTASSKATWGSWLKDKAKSLGNAVVGKTRLGRLGRIGAIALGATLYSTSEAHGDASLNEPSQIAFTDNSIVETPDAPFDGIRAANVGIDGVYEGAMSTTSTVIGAPVDFMNFALGKIGLGSDNPFLGSQQIQGALTSAYNTYANNFAPGLLQEPENAAERAIHMTGEFTGAAVASGGIIGGLRSLAAKTGISGFFADSAIGVATTNPLTPNTLPTTSATLGFKIP